MHNMKTSSEVWENFNRVLDFADTHVKNGMICEDERNGYLAAMLDLPGWYCVQSLNEVKARYLLHICRPEFSIEVVKDVFLVARVSEEKVGPTLEWILSGKGGKFTTVKSWEDIAPVFDEESI